MHEQEIIESDDKRIASLKAMLQEQREKAAKAFEWLHAIADATTLKELSDRQAELRAFLGMPDLSL